MIRTRGQNAKSDKNVFLAAEGMDIPIYKHSKESLAKNKKFKMNLLNGTKQALKDRYDNVGQFSFLSVFHPKCIDKFLDEHPMPNKIKNSRKNAIVDWFIDCGFAKDDIKKSVDHWLSYYSKLDGASGHEIMYKYKHIEDTQLRNYIWILYTNKIKSKKLFWERKFGELKKRCLAIAVLGRHHLIAPWNTGICERGFSEQNQNITKLRVRIETELLRDLMMVALNGPDIGTKEFYDVIIRALKLWSVNKNYK
eukprot:162447_1